MNTNVLSAAMALTVLSACANNNSFTAGQTPNYLTVLQEALLQPPSQSDLDRFNGVTFDEYFQALVSGTTNDSFQLGDVTVTGVHDRLLHSASLFERLQVQYSSVGAYFNTLELDLSQPLGAAVVDETYADLATDFNEQDGWFGGDMSASAGLTETAHSVTLQQTDQVLRNIAAVNAIAVANASPLEVGFGLYTNPSANCDQPSVVKLETADFRTCSGVAISSTQVLTAAHCVAAGKRLSYVGEDGKTYKSSEVAVNPGFTYDPENVAKTGGFDNAVATFDANSALATSPLAAGSVKPGDNVSMAGYGSIGPDKDAPVDTGNLHCGYNVVKSTTVHQATIQITGVVEGGQNIPDGQDSISRPGDSGGPMFNDKGQVVGIASHSIPDRASYSNINDPANKKFLAESIKSPTTPAAQADPAKRNPFLKTTPLSQPTGNNPLAKPAPSSQWCDGSVCFPRCTNGSHTGNGFGWQPSLGGPNGGSCKS